MVEKVEQELEDYKPPKLKRDWHGRLLPGQGSLNPGGRPKDMRNAQNKLHRALRAVEKQMGKKFLEHYIRESFKDRTMAIALLKKIVPDLKAVEVDSQTKEAWQVIVQNFAKSKEEDEREGSSLTDKSERMD